MTVETWLKEAEKHGEYHADLKVALQIIRRSREALKEVRSGALFYVRAQELAHKVLKDCDAIVSGETK